MRRRSQGRRRVREEFGKDWFSVEQAMAEGSTRYGMWDVSYREQRRPSDSPTRRGESSLST